MNRDDRSATYSQLLEDQLTRVGSTMRCLNVCQVAQIQENVREAGHVARLFLASFAEKIDQVYDSLTIN